MADTANLALPFIEGSQAQKHVTHNEALQLLDAVIQLAVLDRDLAAPPALPAEGQRWIVAASPTGAWAGHATHVAVWQDGGWQFSIPQTGWIAYVIDESALLVWKGSAWDDATIPSSGAALQNLALLGLGTTADGLNPFSAKLCNALWVATTVAEGGTGDLRYKLSKEAPSNTLSLLFQDNFSGRAEIGLTGDDNFHFKVSPDGSAWYDAISIDRTSGRVSFPVGGGPREVLTANRTYYVRTDGNDANSGRVNTSGGAFLTVQKAVDTVASLDCATHQATIQLVDPGSVASFGGTVTLRPCVAALPPIIQGNAATPANVVVNATGDAFLNAAAGIWQIRNLKVTATSNGIEASNGGIIWFQNLDFGACGFCHIFSGPMSSIRATGSYRVSGNAQYHIGANGFVDLKGGITITYANSPAFSGANFLAGRGSVIDCGGITFTNGGTVTGSRYATNLNGVIFTTSGGNATYIPGSTPGTSVTGGQYS